MMNDAMTAARQAAAQFRYNGEVTDCRPFGDGHINDTFRVTVETGEGRCRFVLQRLNTGIFLHPEEVMENIERVTAHLRRKVIDAGGDPLREVLTLVRTKDGSTHYTDADGNFWRSTLFIENAVCYEKAQSDELFRCCAMAFGNFQHQLADFPAATLHETIPDFHNTPKRFEAFMKAVEEDKAGRAESVSDLIDFLESRKALSHALTDRQDEGKLPLRVTHNDAKMNNIMLDPSTLRAVCILDLDTVMPGLAAVDFGDSIRSGASTAAEDEKDLSKVHFSRHLYDVYRDGFILGCGGALTRDEEDSLGLGAKVITYEQALRFLTDYLEGDAYYKTDYPEHNLVRTRTQVRLLKEMEEQI